MTILAFVLSKMAADEPVNRSVMQRMRHPLYDFRLIAAASELHVK